jgi:hypothetical protein
MCASQIKNHKSHTHSSIEACTALQRPFTTLSAVRSYNNPVSCQEVSNASGAAKQLEASLFLWVLRHQYSFTTDPWQLLVLFAGLAVLLKKIDRVRNSSSTQLPHFQRHSFAAALITNQARSAGEHGCPQQQLLCLLGWLPQKLAACPFLVLELV